MPLELVMPFKQKFSLADIQDDFTAWDYLVMGVYGLIVVISLFGNGLVFSVIIRTR